MLCILISVKKNQPATPKPGGDIHGSCDVRTARSFQGRPGKEKDQQLFEQFRDWIELGWGGVGKCSYTAGIISVAITLLQFCSICKLKKKIYIYILSGSSFLEATQPVFMHFPYCSDSVRVCPGQSRFPFLIIC